MLYDNALLLNVFAEAYLITGEQKYRSVVEETLGFMERELRHPDGGFLVHLMPTVKVLKANITPGVKLRLRKL